MLTLYDAEIVAAAKVVGQLTRKYGRRTWSSTASFNRLSEELETEATARLAEVGLLVEVKTLPMLVGQPPVIEITGRIDNSAFDHELKRHEVLKSKINNETIHGESRIED